MRISRLEVAFSQGGTADIELPDALSIIRGWDGVIPVRWRISLWMKVKGLLLLPDDSISTIFAFWIKRVFMIIVL